MATPRSRTAKLLPFFFGVAIVGVIIYITIRYPTAIHANYSVYKWIMAIVGAFVAALLPGSFEIRYKGLLRATGALGVFVFVMLYQHEDKPFNVRIVVVPKTEEKLEPNGKVLMILGQEQREGILGTKNEVLFENIPHSYYNQKASFQTNFTEKYVPDFPDSLYELRDDQIIQLRVHLDLKNVISGTVIYQDNPLDGVTVSVGNLRDTTDALGFYELKLLQTGLQDEQIVSFYKNGFKLKRVTVHLQTLKTLDMLMEK